VTPSAILNKVHLNGYIPWLSIRLEVIVRMCLPFPNIIIEPRACWRSGWRFVKYARCRGISQEQLALRTGLDRSYMGGVERGDNNVTLLKTHIIAKTLGLTLLELLAKVRL
jgi:hypothetical protein